MYPIETELGTIVGRLEGDSLYEYPAKAEIHPLYHLSREEALWTLIWERLSTRVLQQTKLLRFEGRWVLAYAPEGRAKAAVRANHGSWLRVPRADLFDSIKDEAEAKRGAA